MDNLYIIIPAYNEEANIESVAREWHKIVQRIGNSSKLVIIDDGSKDTTYSKLTALQKELPCLVPLQKANSGHGATIYYGYQYALSKNAAFIFQTDSDGQTVPHEFWRFWKLRKQYEAIIGNRISRKDGTSRIFVTKVLKLVVFCIFGVKVTDCNTPFRLMQKSVLQKRLKQVPENFNLTNVMLSVLFVKKKDSLLFLPITFRQRQGGVNSINIRRIIQIGCQAVKDFSTIKKSL